MMGQGERVKLGSDLQWSHLQQISCDCIISAVVLCTIDVTPELSFETVQVYL